MVGFCKKVATITNVMIFWGYKLATNLKCEKKKNPVSH